MLQKMKFINYLYNKKLLRLFSLKVFCCIKSLKITRYVILNRTNIRYTLLVKIKETTQ